jgi:hypothetical protein
MQLDAAIVQLQLESFLERLLRILAAHLRQQVLDTVWGLLCRLMALSSPTARPSAAV